MKIFQCIGFASVAGILFASAHPGISSTDWVYIGKSNNKKTTNYVKIIAFRGPLPEFLWKTANTDNPQNVPYLADCNAWSYKDVQPKLIWQDALSGSTADNALQAIVKLRRNKICLEKEGRVDVVAIYLPIEHLPLRLWRFL